MKVAVDQGLAGLGQCNTLTINPDLPPFPTPKGRKRPMSRTSCGRI